MAAQYKPYPEFEEFFNSMENDPLGWPAENEPAIKIYEKTTESMPYAQRNRSFLWIFSLSLFIGIIGFMIGYFSHKNHSECIHNKMVAFDSVRDEDPSTRANLIANIRSQNIRLMAREFSREPHMTSTPEDFRLATKIQSLFKSYHFDRSVMKNYTALLSLPDESKPNFVSLLNANNRQEVYSSLKKHPVHSFSAYSPKGDVTGDVLFVNYGRPVDYVYLQQLFGNESEQTFKGKIFLAKQYHLSASEQYKYAVAMNASALLLYPDPQHYNPKNEKPYPDSVWLPPDGVRSDSIFWNGAGDPETFGSPSHAHAFRDSSDLTDSVSIPAQPISYETAQEILKKLNGPNAPGDWKGGLNLTYRIGPGLRENLKVRVCVNNVIVRKTIYNVIGTIRGRIEPDRYVLVGNQRDSLTKGAIDAATGVGTFLEIARVFGDLVATKNWRPRRSLVFCSWGAEEHNLIGSTEFVEDTVKVLQARAVAYINVNLVVNGNDTLSVAASPLLYHAIFNATKDVFLPKNKLQSDDYRVEQEFNTIYDKWIVSMPKMRNVSSLLFPPNEMNTMQHLSTFGLNEKEIELDRHRFHQQESSDPKTILKTYLESAFQEIRPMIRSLDMFGSYAPFYSMAGIPVADLCFISLKNEDKELKGENEGEFERILMSHLPYPLLHTQYDEIDVVERFVDPNFQYHTIAAQILTHIIERTVDSLFLPFNIFDYAQVLRDFYIKTSHMHSVVLLSHSLNNKKENPTIPDSEEDEAINTDLIELDLKNLESAISNFTEEALRFHAYQDRIDFNDPMMIRKINDKLMLVERQFIDHRGIPNNHLKRHLVLSPAETINQFDSEGLFPALLDELDQIMSNVISTTTTTTSTSSLSKNIRPSLIRLKKHLPILIDTIQGAAESLSFAGDYF